MQSSPALGDTASNAVSFSALASEALDGVAPKPLSFFLLGATGRTGLPFLSLSLARGHSVTIYVRSVSKLPEAVASHPHLHTFTGALHEAEKITLAVQEAAPDVVYIMLASEKAPYTAVSMGTLHTLRALEALRDLSALRSGAMPLITIAAWGLGPTAAYVTSFSAQMFVRVLTTLFWSKARADFDKQLKGSERCRTRSANPYPTGDTYQRQKTKRLPVGGGKSYQEHHERYTFREPGFLGGPLSEARRKGSNW